jgi:GxxExxY protein
MKSTSPSRRNMELNEITHQIIDSAFRVHSELGPGLLESAYSACLAHELRKRRLRVSVQVELPIVYDGVVITPGYRVDRLVEDVVIVELKAMRKLPEVCEAQLLSYLKLSGRKVGLLINFHCKRLIDGVTRLVNGYTPPASEQ